MTNEEKDIELIEDFLDQNLSEEQVKEFEKRLESDKEFESLYSFQKSLRQKVVKEERKALKTDLEKMHDAYRSGSSKVWKQAAWAFLVAIILSVSYVTVFNDYLDPENNTQNKHSEPPEDNLGVDSSLNKIELDTIQDRHQKLEKVLEISNDSIPLISRKHIQKTYKKKIKEYAFREAELMYKYVDDTLHLFGLHPGKYFEMMIKSYDGNYYLSYQDKIFSLEAVKKPVEVKEIKDVRILDRLRFTKLHPKTIVLKMHNKISQKPKENWAADIFQSDTVAGQFLKVDFNKKEIHLLNFNANLATRLIDMGTDDYVMILGNVLYRVDVKKKDWQRAKVVNESEIIQEFHGSVVRETEIHIFNKKLFSENEGY